MNSFSGHAAEFGLPSAGLRFAARSWPFGLLPEFGNPYARPSPASFMSSNSDQPTASFVVIARDEASTIEASLRSILAQEVEKEVVVVDDGSRDRTAEVVERLAAREPAVRLIRLPQSRGRGFARRSGIEAARGRLIATVDGDVILPEDWWQRCAEALPNADAVAGTAVPDGDVAYLYGRFSLRPRTRSHTTPVTGSNGLYRREVFDRAAFDPSLRDGEDIALGYELQAAGARLATVPGLFVEHRDSRTFAQAMLWLFQSGIGATRLLRRYRDVRRPDLATAGFLVAIGTSAGLRGRARLARLAPPVGYLFAAASAHVLSAFTVERGRVRQLLGATIVDVPLLTAYFVGRIVGVVGLVRAARRRS